MPGKKNRTPKNLTKKTVRIGGQIRDESERPKPAALQARAYVVRAEYFGSGGLVDVAHNTVHEEGLLDDLVDTTRRKPCYES